MEVQDVKDLANFYGITEFDLFQLAFIWRYERVPDEMIIEADYKQFIGFDKIPHYVSQFVLENPLIDDNGTLIEKWLSLLEVLRRKNRGGGQFVNAA